MRGGGSTLRGAKIVGDRDVLVPAQPKRMSRRIRVSLMPMSGVETLGGLQKPGTQRDGVLVGSPAVLDVEIKMDLLLLFPRVRLVGRIARPGVD